MVTDYSRTNAPHRPIAANPSRPTRRRAAPVRPPTSDKPGRKRRRAPTVRSRADAPAFRAIADPTRRAILDRLAAAPLTVHELARHFTVSRPAISKHLRLLLAARLVAAETRGRTRTYTLHPEPLAEVDIWLSRYRLFWQARLMALKSFVEETADSNTGGPR